MLNPITYTERVVGDFLRYQLTTYPFADQALYDQMRHLLNLEETRATPLLKGPYMSLSRSFRKGAPLRDLVEEGILHPHLPALKLLSDDKQKEVNEYWNAAKIHNVDLGPNSGLTLAHLSTVTSKSKTAGVSPSTLPLSTVCPRPPVPR